MEDFPDVFPEELVNLPPERSVEFTIDFLPGIGPIWQVAYRMGPEELRELQKQFDELLEKGHIRMSSSPGELRFCLPRRQMALFASALIIES